MAELTSTMKLTMITQEQRVAAARRLLEEPFSKVGMISTVMDTTAGNSQGNHFPP
jgi:hypothetical protein